MTNRGTQVALPDGRVHGPDVDISAMLAPANGATVLRIENDTQQALAIQRPRNVVSVVKAAEDELSIAPEFAEKVLYKIPYTDRSDGDERKVNVEGIGTHGAAMLARLWTNNSHGVRLTGETPTHVHMEGVFMDFETNTRTVRPYAVAKMAWRKALKQEITLSARELQQAIMIGISKTDRNVIIASIPPAVKIAFMAKAKSLIAKRANPDNVEIMLAQFKQFGVSKRAVLKYAGVSATSGIIGDVFVSLTATLNALVDGELQPHHIDEPQVEKKSAAVVDKAARANKKPADDPGPQPPPTVDPAPPKDTPLFILLRAELQSLADDPKVDAAGVQKWGASEAKRMTGVTPGELLRLRNLYTMTVAAKK